MEQLSSWYKNKDTDVIWWYDDPEDLGTLVFSFDRKKKYYLFKDYHTLTPEQKAIFDKENPEWAQFFS